jgi:hypothetical protein
MLILHLRRYEQTRQNMALAGCCPSIADLGDQLHTYEKGAAIFFNLSDGFP